jgi:Fe-S-cluster containining protein
VQNGHTPVANGTYALSAQLDELNRQIERGSLFTQATLQRSFTRLDTLESVVMALVDALSSRGVVSHDELGIAVVDDDEEVLIELGPDEAVAAEEASDEEPATAEPIRATVTAAHTGITWPAIAVRVETEEPQDRPDVEVDCAARMHVCQAVCCKLKFPLSAEEIDGGHVKWDIGHPYIIRQESNGMCTHNIAGSCGCSIYENRPGVCRRYSCANDARIWTDFDNMVLNQEWIDAHVGRRDLRVSAVLPSMDESETWSPEPVE